MYIVHGTNSEAGWPPKRCRPAKGPAAPLATQQADSGLAAATAATAAAGRLALALVLRPVAHLAVAGAVCAEWAWRER